MRIRCDLLVLILQRKTHFYGKRNNGPPVNPVREMSENICVLEALDIGITGTLVTELAAIRVSLWPLHRHIMGELERLIVHWRGRP